MATVKRILQPQIAEDGSVSYFSLKSPPDDSIAVCYMVPDRTIPVIFVPGIMGSNLCSKENKPVWVVDSSKAMLPWVPRNAAFRKATLDPAKTRIFDGGKLPTGTSLPAAELRRRGWGTVSRKSYGDWLVWLQNALDDCYPGTDYGRKGLRASLMDTVIAPGLEKLTEAEVGRSYRYRLPVHAVGYNWLQSNEDASRHLGNEIDRIIKEYRYKGRCERVIIVTHSMGGLVARHCSEVRGYRDKIFGIVHGVMPATGSATAYKRVKSGTESDGSLVGLLASLVLGATAEEVTAVFAQAPGALQLLPGPDYGNGWLKIRDGELPVLSLPQRGDPYEEIYTQRHVWWGLIDQRIINPLDEGKKSVDQDWMRFAKLIKEEVDPFHDEISRRYHPHTYAFYGDDPQRKTWGDVVWLCRRSPTLWKDAGSLLDDPRYGAMDKPIARDDRVGAIDVLAGRRDWIPIHKTFRIQPGSENGDGTVPVRSGRAPEQFARACVGFAGIDHERAYNPTPKPQSPQFFALWAITRIIGNVKGTAMDYPL